MPEALPDDFAAALASSAARRGVFGEPLIFLASTASTNDIASRLAEQGAPQGAVVVALEQTAGRGRHGREWFSPPGAGLYISIVLRDAAIAPMLTLAGGVAVARGIQRATGLPVSIKWPNDIVVTDEHAPGGRRKLAGILAEGSAGARGLQHVVLGIGINIRPAEYPASLAQRVTSLEHELGRAVDAGLVLSEVLVSVNEQVVGLKAGGTARMLDVWRSLSPSASGAAVSWSDPAGIVRGTTAGIDPGGALLIQDGERMHRVISGEVIWH